MYCLTNLANEAAISLIARTYVKLRPSTSIQEQTQAFSLAQSLKINKAKYRAQGPW
jgi:hypothetical protein